MWKMTQASGSKLVSLAQTVARAWYLPTQVVRRNLALTAITRQEASENTDASVPPSSAEDPKDRTRIIPVEVSMKYMSSSAYQETYGNGPVWRLYRRNFKGRFAPPPRKMCIRAGKISTGNPCPICRDEYLILDYRNTKLLEQFVSPHDGRILENMKTGLCRKKQDELLVAIHKAKEYGLIQFDVPYRHYDYSEYQQ